MSLPARPVSFRWDEAFVQRLDKACGDVPRSRFVRRAIEAAMRSPEPEQRTQPLTPEIAAFESDKEFETAAPAWLDERPEWGGVGSKPPIPKRSKR